MPLSMGGVLAAVPASAVVAVIGVVFAALIAAAASVAVAKVVMPRVRPEVPAVHAGALAGTSALIAAGLAVSLPGLWLQALVALAVPLLVAAAVTDAWTMRIPNQLVVNLLMVAAVMSGFALADGVDLAAVAVSWLLAALVFALLLGANVVSGGGFGMGDVKVAAPMTVMLTLACFASWGELPLVPAPLLAALVVVAWLALSFLFGAVWALARRLGKADSFAFGPFLAAAWGVAVVAAPFAPSLF